MEVERGAGKEWKEQRRCGNSRTDLNGELGSELENLELQDIK